jgi:anti-sigma28 factor (negative regulator of flagellin synthesis)
MASRREAGRTDETTHTEGIRRNLQLDDISAFAEATGMSIERLVEAERQNRLVAAIRLAGQDQKFSKAAIGDAARPIDILKRVLSVRSVLSTDSSFAERMEALKDADPKNMKLSVIGIGSFGVVFEIPGMEWCLKKTLVNPLHLWTEFVNGKIVSEAVNGDALKVILKSGEFDNALMPRVPKYYCSFGMGDVESTEHWFKQHGHLFPADGSSQKPGPVIGLERIMPLPKIIRHSLIRHYFKPEEQNEALADVKNKACICRPYLGSTSDEVKSDKRERERRTLQNFPLYLDMLDELEMDAFTIARDMALGLAAGHWSARIDMMDVEFVIGSRQHLTIPDLAPLSKVDEEAARSKSTHRVRNMSTAVANQRQAPSFHNRAIQLWMIDFDKVSTLNTTVEKGSYEANIDKLVYATRATDGPYHPRVLARTQKEWNLWLAFAKTYINASRTILNAQLQPSRDAGVSMRKEEELVLKRPSRVINKWMEAECRENGVTSKQFKALLKQKGWAMP